MSKENFFRFLSKASKDEQLQEKISGTANPEDLVGIAQAEGYDFSSEHIDEGLSELQQKPGFFSALAAAVFKIFSPPHDDYPVTGVQPFSGDPNPNP
ncbi:Nif11-like leader peptide family RiPP precursor [Lyngbya confervoides]|uniref:Nif11-like leader peptide family RiPP precursor n=1 Tax=Lyngbya confervoides TaxID=207921 RepID=UPI00140D0137